MAHRLVHTPNPAHHIAISPWASIPEELSRTSPHQSQLWFSGLPLLSPDRTELPQQRAVLLRRLRMARARHLEPQRPPLTVYQIPNPTPTSDLHLPLLHLHPTMRRRRQRPLQLMMTRSHHRFVRAQTQFIPGCTRVSRCLLTQLLRPLLASLVANLNSQPPGTAGGATRSPRFGLT